MLRYRDPASGREVTRTLYTENVREQERQAALWEEEISRTVGAGVGECSYDYFVERYNAEHLSSLSPNTAKAALASLDVLQSISSPARVSAVTSSTLSVVASTLRSRGVRESTIAKHMRHIRAAMQWGVDVGLVASMPSIPRLKRSGRTDGVPHKGRAITEEEFRSILESVPLVVGDCYAAPWRWYLRGLWFSGLRLSESLSLSWDRKKDCMSVVIAEEPYLLVPAGAEKGHRDRHLPIAPEFSAMLAGVPEEHRRGRVFPIPSRLGCSPKHWWVSRQIGRFSRHAGVFTEPGKPAGAHDLRRSFGTRWASLVMPQVLMRIMRHESISTTMRYYVTADAARTSREMRAALGDFSGDMATTARSY